MKKLFLLILFSATKLWAAEYTPEAYLKEGLQFEKRGEYFQAARYYFQALQRANDESGRAHAYAYISNALAAEGLHQSASYFFLKAVGTGDDRAIRLALRGTRALVSNVGGAIFKKYILKYTREEQYPRDQRDYYLYFMAQDQLHNLRPHDVVRAVNDMAPEFPFFAEALFLRGTAQLMLNNIVDGIKDFKSCLRFVDQSYYKKFQTAQEMRELKNRCTAGVARGHYQAKEYAQAELWYEAIEMGSFVWPQVQYERAWNAVARGDYNRALGRLVTYKAPGLSWFHDSEVEMLRSISYLQMCIYEDVDKESEFFMKKYGRIGEELKALLDEASGGSTKSLVKLFELGMSAAMKKVQSEKPLDQVLNRFVRSPYFIQLVKTGDKVRRETAFINSLGPAAKKGLGGFLKEVLVWRWQTAQELGGIFVRDRLSTEYKSLLANVSTIDIVKLEMLRRAKSRIEQVDPTINVGSDVWGTKKRGSLGKPSSKEGQYFWDFNGEFWSDELGDYTFALRPECY